MFVCIVIEHFDVLINITVALVYIVRLAKSAFGFIQYFENVILAKLCGQVVISAGWHLFVNFS